MAARQEHLATALDQLGDRWSLAVVDALLGGNHRFGELLDALPGLAPNILSRRLSHLESAGLTISRAYQRRPPRFTYEATERARALEPVIDALVDWAAPEDGIEDAGDGEPIWI